MSKKGEGRATPKGIELVDKQLLESLKEAHRRIHYELDESEMSQHFVKSCEKFRDEDNPESVCALASALLKRWTIRKYLL